MNEFIDMPLLDEGLSVWRPVPAYRLADGAYIVLRPADYNEVDEHWQFPPGSVVSTAGRTTTEGSRTTAVALAGEVRRTA